jgi:hypothetical protein
MDPDIGHNDANDDDGDQSAWDELLEWLDLPEGSERSGDDSDESVIAGSETALAPEEAPTPGERLLYVLGQLYRLHRAGELSMRPQDVDVEVVARLIGVSSELEFSTCDGLGGTHYHFPAEVLHLDPDSEFPWRLLGLWEWAETN